MPPRKSGGKRQGAVGVVHPNRVDLNETRIGQPVKPIPGAYGSGVRQEADLAANPLPQVPTPSAARLPAPQAARGPMVLPPALGDPTRRPDEPVTAGVDIGPGPGSEILSGISGRIPTLADTLEQAANASGSEALLQLARRAASIGQ